MAVNVPLAAQQTLSSLEHFFFNACTRKLSMLIHQDIYRSDGLITQHCYFMKMRCTVTVKIILMFFGRLYTPKNGSRADKALIQGLHEKNITFKKRHAKNVWKLRISTKKDFSFLKVHKTLIKISTKPKNSEERLTTSISCRCSVDLIEFA